MLKQEKILKEIKESPKGRIKVNFGTKKYELCFDMVLDGLLESNKTNPLSNIYYFSIAQNKEK